MIQQCHTCCLEAVLTVHEWQFVKRGHSFPPQPNHLRGPRGYVGDVVATLHLYHLTDRFLMIVSPSCQRRNYCYHDIHLRRAKSRTSHTIFSGHVHPLIYCYGPSRLSSHSIASPGNLDIIRSSGCLELLARLRVKRLRCHETRWSDGDRLCSRA